MRSKNSRRLWIDTTLAAPGGGALALKAGAPERVWSGGPEAYAVLATVAARLPAPEPGRLPETVLAGYITYEQRFWFGLYRGVEWVPSTSWQDVEGPWRAGAARASLDPATYADRVRLAQHYIRQGDIYQVNLCRVLEASFEGSAEAFYSALRRVSPAPCSALIQEEDFAVVSASPELLLRVEGRVARTEPIKGTRPRSRDAEEDERLRQQLKESEKEMAELVMITDLERNDLGRVCEYGSVRVPVLAEARSFAQVHHLVSVVEGRLRHGVSHAAALWHCFPGGSITGAPKKRAMEIIGALEPSPRGVLCGTIGFFGAGLSHFNVAIRSAEIRGGKIRFGAGSGITCGSDPEGEYEETTHKLAGIEEVLRGP